MTAALVAVLAGPPPRWAVRAAAAGLAALLGAAIAAWFVGLPTFWAIALTTVGLTLALGVAAAALAWGLGAALGLEAGCVGGGIDRTVSGTARGLERIPPPLSAILIAAALSATDLDGWLIAVLAASIALWARATLPIRDAAAELMHRNYVRASRLAGKSMGFVIRRHVAPAIAPTLTQSALVVTPMAVVLETAITYLGLGASPATPTLGGLLRETQELARTGAATGRDILATTAAVSMLAAIWLCFDILRRAPRAAAAPARKLSVSAPPEEPPIPAVLSAGVSVRRLSIAGGAGRSVDDVSFDAQPGRVLALTGDGAFGGVEIAAEITGAPHSGARRVSGGVWVDGAIVEEAPPPADETVSERLARAWSSRQTLPSETAPRETLAKALDAVGAPGADWLLEARGDALSPTMRRRVTHAEAALAETNVFAVVEPSAALDAPVRDRLVAAVRDAADRRGAAVVLVTRDIALIAATADDLAVLYAGRVMEAGPAREMLSDPWHPYTWGLWGGVLGAGGPPPRPIPGTAPPAEASPRGCPFHPRCPRSFGPCERERAPEVVRGRGRLACWLHHPAIAEPPRPRRDALDAAA